MTVDIEEWFNILDVPGEIPLEYWERQEPRLVKNLERLLDLFDEYHIKVTMFWLGYFAEKYPNLLKRCYADGHEIACHGYAHLLAYKVGPERFAEDIRRGKCLIENIIGAPVLGFRAAGFSVIDGNDWFFEEIARAGFAYDSSVFPTRRGHGGMDTWELNPHIIRTPSGALLEIPQSVIEIMGKKISFFGGGYLRFFPLPTIKYAVKKLHENGRPLILYVHPREVDPGHPHLQMNTWRRFKSYVNLKSTYPKLKYMCENYSWELMKTLLEKSEANRS